MLIYRTRYEDGSHFPLSVVCLKSWNSVCYRDPWLNAFRVSVCLSWNSTFFWWWSTQYDRNVLRLNSKTQDRQWEFPEPLSYQLYLGIHSARDTWLNAFTDCAGCFEGGRESASHFSELINIWSFIIISFLDDCWMNLQ